MLAEQVENAWRESSAGRLRYDVGGNADLAHGVLTYLQSRPELLPESPMRQTIRVIQYGAALVCFQEESACIDASSRIASRNPASRNLETELVRNFLGIDGRPHLYVIFIVPPSSS
jgi:hypothetical protein